MGDANKRHIYYDQQIPFEEPDDAERAKTLQGRFARRPPTLEDDYFYRQEHGPFAPFFGRSSVSAESAGAAPVGEPDSVWQKFYRAVSRWFDLSWRP